WLDEAAQPAFVPASVDSFEQADPGTQDGREDELLARKNGCVHFLERGFDPMRRQFEISRHLIAEQERDLAQEAPETRRRSMLVAHDAELVLDQWKIDDGNTL